MDLKVGTHTFWKQFMRNMWIGVAYSSLWYYGFFIWIKSFIVATILTNIIAFYVGRYYIFREGIK